MRSCFFVLIAVIALGVGGRFLAAKNSGKPASVVSIPLGAPEKAVTAVAPAKITQAMRQEEVMQLYGKPVSRDLQADGSERWTYVSGSRAVYVTFSKGRVIEAREGDAPVSPR